MRILRIIKSVDPAGGGPVEGLLRQAACLEAQGVVTEVVSLDDEDSSFVKSFPLKHYALGGAASRSSLNRIYPLRRYGYTAGLVPWLRAHVRRYDLVIVHGIWNYATFGARRALVGSGVPYVVFSHGMMDPWFRKAYPLKTIGKQLSWLFCEGPLLNNASAVLFTTEEERILSQGAFWPYHVKEQVVGYGTHDVAGDAESQVAAFRSSVPKLGNRPYLLYLSRIHPKKGCDLLLEAFADISRERSEFDLVMAGPDRANWVPRLQAQARELGIDMKVHWPGMLKGDIKWGAFRGAEAFVLPSHQENFGIVVAEAMAASLPVLITNKVNIWREVSASRGGLVCDDTVVGTTEVLTKFLNLSVSERKAMGQAARDFFLANYEVQHISEKQLKFFKTISKSSDASCLIG